MNKIEKFSIEINNFMELLNILYTPLDTIPVPDYDQKKLLFWIQSNQKQHVPGRRDASKYTPDEKYPWNICYPRLNRAWQNKFNEHFPELSAFFHNAYNLQEEDIFSVVLLPIKSNFIGEGFWHADPDETGLRMYLENTESDKNFLLMKASKIAYNTQPEIKYRITGEDERFHETVLSAKILNSRQVFFLNNVRAIHSANVSTMGAFRIAVIVTLNKKITEIPQHLKNLIISSAEKYKSIAVIRTE